MAAKIICDVLETPIAESLLQNESVWKAADVRVRMLLARYGFEVACGSMNHVRGQLWERLAEWGERQ